MADVTSAILKKHAEGTKGAEYWTQTEQEMRLIAAFEKWAKKGTVWSAASQKVRGRCCLIFDTSLTNLDPFKN